jgi:hypothetical protein
MIKEEIEAVAKVAGKEAALETLLALGIDAQKPLETQRDFAHLRWWRTIMESVMRTMITTGTISFFGTLATLLYAGFRLTWR